MKKAVFSIKRLNASYKTKNILKNISLEIESGKVTCLCGKNGCGKSTLLSILTKLSGEGLKISAEQWPQIQYKEETTENNQNDFFNVYKETPKEIAKKIAYMQQSEYSVWDFTVEDFILAGRYAHTEGGVYTSRDYEIVSEILDFLEIEKLAKKGVHSLSGGEFQKVRLGRALAQQPEFLLLDEPINNIDFIYESKMLELLKKLCQEKGIGVFLIIHDLNLAARYADKIILLPENESPLCGTVNEVFTTENLMKTFNSELQTYMHPIYNCIQVYEK